MSDNRPVSSSLIGAPLAVSIRLAHSKRIAPVATWLVLGMALLAGRMAHAQAPIPQFPQPIGQHVGGGLDDGGEPDQIDAARRFRALNDMRQKGIVSDTNKLLKLASELNAEIRKANSDSLTPEQLHKLATIEKLARSVKDKMSTPVGGMPSYQPPPTPVMH